MTAARHAREWLFEARDCCPDGMPELERAAQCMFDAAKMLRLAYDRALDRYEMAAQNEQEVTYQPLDRQPKE